jgi:hypothetical protein
MWLDYSLYQKVIWSKLHGMQHYLRSDDCRCMRKPRTCWLIQPHRQAKVAIFPAGDVQSALCSCLIHKYMTNNKNKSRWLVRKSGTFFV